VICLPTLVQIREAKPGRLSYRWLEWFPRFPIVAADIYDRQEPHPISLLNMSNITFPFLSKQLQ
jgi:hypothetical protein